MKINKLFNALRGAVTIVLLAINLVVSASLVLLFGFFAWIIPNKTWRHHGIKITARVPIWWMDINRLLIHLSAHQTFDIQGPQDLNPKGTYLMISNHQDWLDILIINDYFNRKTPILKFFMKKELLWQLPVAGLACYFLGYPFLHRHKKSDIRKNPELKGKDIETAKKACAKFKEFPTTIINFVEGTRFSAAKHERQQSPYRHLLKPKAAGIAVVYQEMHQHLDGIIDVTVQYSNKPISLWKFVSGGIDTIALHYQVLPVDPALVGDYYNDRLFRKRFQAWLNELWQQKDALLERLG